MFRRLSLFIVAFAAIAGIVLALPRHLNSRVADGGDFVHFESGHVRPASLTPSGDRLLVVNTPDARLSVFDVTGGALVRLAEIPVGLEPVAVTAFDDSTAWVVNNVSDDVSIVNLNTMHVRATLRVGDEPSDVIFAGTPPKAYVSVSEEDVIRVYDPATLALEATIPIPARMPRSLARTADGTKVYTVSLEGNNATTILTPGEVADSIPDDPEMPRDTGNKLGHPAPKVAGIVRKFGPDWTDMYGKLWNAKIKYTPLDNDVIEISTTTNTVTRTFSASGSTNFGVAVNPVDGRIAVINTDGRNQLRYEPRLSGYLNETQIGFITQAGAFTRRILNPHIVYDFTPGPQSDTDSALGLPTGVVYSPDGVRAYVTAMANDKIGVLNPAASGSPSMVRARVPTLQGPSGLVLDAPRNRLYVVGRFRNEVQTLSTANFAELGRVSIGLDPTPNDIVHGRRFFYGGFTSGHGDQACANCHVFADTDHLVWDLGDPFAPYLPGTPPLDGFDPQKGPMVTQSLRGLPGTGVLHWRGDRADLPAFNAAFVGLLGRSTALPDSQLTAMNAFIAALTYPPNPHQNLDRTFRDAPPGVPSALRGRQLFETALLDTAGGTPVTCAGCHTHTSFGSGTNGAMIPNEVIFDAQDLKVPQLRNLYKKRNFTRGVGDTPKRTSGFSHNGTVASVVEFLGRPEFAFDPDTAISNPEKRDLEAYLVAFDTGMAPVVGHQVTWNGSPNPAGLARLDTLKAQAALDYCDLIAWGIVNGMRRGFKYTGGDLWQVDYSAQPALNTNALLGFAAPGHEVTVMAVPKGTGTRMALDRDRDGYYGGDEELAGSLPDFAGSTPANVGVSGGGAGLFGLRGPRPNPSSGPVEIAFGLARSEVVRLAVYDVLGREVRDLSNGRTFAAGPHVVTWDGRRGDGAAAGAGVYFVQLRTGSGRSTKSLIRVR